MKIVALVVLAGCGGLVTAPTSDASAPADAADASTLSVCAHACVVATAGDCPTLLLYECLQPACGPNASTSICEQGDGNPAPVATIQCVKNALPTCPASACQSDQTCKTFVACIEGCGG